MQLQIALFVFIGTIFRDRLAFVRETIFDQANHSIFSIQKADKYIEPKHSNLSFMNECVNSLMHVLCNDDYMHELVCHG